MSDDREKRKDITGSQESEQGKTVPFVPNNDTANMVAIETAHQSRAGTAVIVPPQAAPPLPLPVLGAGIQSGAMTETG